MNKKEKTPQEEITAIREVVVPKSRSEEENKEYCQKYPFLIWHGDPLYPGYKDENIDYRYSWEDELPDGWRMAFCPQIWDELKEILIEGNYLNEFRFMQIKEKYGTLRLYYNDFPKSIGKQLADWEDKYYCLSEQHCIYCGKPVKYMTPCYITYICEDCKNQMNEQSLKEHGLERRFIPIEDIDEFYEDQEAYCKKQDGIKNDQGNNHIN